MIHAHQIRPSNLATCVTIEVEISAQWKKYSRPIIKISTKIFPCHMTSNPSKPGYKWVVVVVMVELTECPDHVLLWSCSTGIAVTVCWVLELSCSPLPAYPHSCHQLVKCCPVTMVVTKFFQLLIILILCCLKVYYLLAMSTGLSCIIKYPAARFNNTHVCAPYATDTLSFMPLWAPL